MNEHARLATALAFTSLAEGGCLPRGDAPVGRQILPDPSASLTVLASEFAMAAITEAAAADRYPPNGRIVYQFNARFSSPCDGLWLATAP